MVLCPECQRVNISNLLTDFFVQFCQRTFPDNFLDGFSIDSLFLKFESSIRIIRHVLVVLKDFFSHVIPLVQSDLAGLVVRSELQDGHGGMVVRFRLRSRRVPGSKPDFFEE
ncbi:hypothetical protein AVEN_103628-1 [Araneus ventricosus]|uniref:Uncharacterized protein n=1 Tax=Araneus ventricosus TaxID=182803 RepID=A0A4Y2HBI0_ARAVE|nr:hypothetical protein AVEN_103628-1 [Araneus ventricosus]